MTVSSAPCEETGSQFPGARFSRANAFRVLSLPADVELRQIHRQKDRLLVLIELGEQAGTKQYGLPPLRDISKEEILEAVHLLERSEDSLIEELFWVHEVDGLQYGELHDVFGALCRTANGNTAHGAVARHNLAVMHSILAQERADNQGSDHWKEALNIWKEVMDDDVFWTFMKARAVKIGSEKFARDVMKVAVCKRLSSTFSEEIVRAVKCGDLTLVTVLAPIAMEHSSWLELAAALNFVAQQEFKNGFVTLGSILDRLAETTQEGNKAKIRSCLVERERELRDVADAYGSVVRSLGKLADADSWDDAVASAYQRLAGAYLALLDDPDHAIRLIALARERARDPQLIRSTERDWQDIQQVTQDRQRRTSEPERDRRQVQRAVLCREAEVLIGRGDFTGAERKLADALAISTEEQKPELIAMQDRCRRARVLHGVDTTRNSPILHTFSGIGATFHGKRDYDPATRSYVTNHWLTFFFVPIFPLGAYRVTDAHFWSYDIHGKAPLPNSLKKTRWAIIASVSALVLVAVIGRGTSMKAVGAPSKIAIHSTRSARTPKAPLAKSADPPSSETDDVKQERTALNVLLQSLEDRTRKLEAEDAAMRKQGHFLANVANSYAGQDVPSDGQSTYEEVFAKYNRRVEEYKTRVAALKSDYAAYNERVNSLNAREK